MAIINNNVKNVKFLRNNALFATREEALAKIQDEFSSGITDASADGTQILARYGSGSNVKTIAGLIYFADANNKSLTIIDVEGASGDVETLRTEINNKLGEGITSENTASAQLEALSGTAGASSAETSVEGAKSYAKDYTDEQIGNLEYTGVTTGDGVVITNVTEVDGVVSATSANVGGLKLTGYSKGSDSGSVVNTDSINQAISKLEKQIDAEKDARTAAISGLDYTDTAETKHFVAAVDETDGVISITRGEITSSGKTVVITADENDVNLEVNIDNNTLTKDANGVISVTSSALVQYEGDGDTIQIGAVSEGVRTVSSPLTISATTPSEANVKEQYNLVGASGNPIGATIKIYKDSSLYNAYLGHVDDTITSASDPTVVPGTGDTALCFIYLKTDGTYELVAVNVEEFIEENEFASGVTWDNIAKKVKGVVDPQSEVDSNNVPFLTVGADGFKISGIKDEISGVVEDLDATVTGATSGNHVTISIEELDGKLVQSGLTIEENDIASASDLEELSGKAITEVESSNSSISAETAATTDGTVKVDLTTDASKIKMTGFTADASGFTAITSASTVTEAVKAIEGAFLDNEEVISTALNDLNERIDAIESGSTEALNDEIDARKAVDGISGDTYSATTTANYISGATSLNDADQKLDAAINDIADNYISGITVNGTGVTVTNNIAPIAISAATSATTASTANAIVVNTDANGNITLGLNYIDCGTY